VSWPPCPPTRSSWHHDHLARAGSGSAWRRIGRSSRVARSLPNRLPLSLADAQELDVWWLVELVDNATLRAPEQPRRVAEPDRRRQHRPRPRPHPETVTTSGFPGVADPGKVGLQSLARKLLVLILPLRRGTLLLGHTWGTGRISPVNKELGLKVPVRCNVAQQNGAFDAGVVLRILMAVQTDEPGATSLLAA
jgi:hypothetical protein